MAHEQPPTRIVETGQNGTQFGPERYRSLREWALANGHEVGPNGWVSPHTVAAYDQHWLKHRGGGRG